MSGNTFLHIFIYTDVFAIGVVATFAARHAYAHFRPAKQDPDKPHLSTATKEKLLHASEAQLQTALAHSVERLEHDLASTSEQINGLVKRFAGEIVGTEMEAYRKEFIQLHKQAEADLSSIKGQITGHEAEMKAELAKELELEKQLLLKQIDTKLSDAVASFLLETLQHNVDLGNQSDYLVQLLEEHKADFVREVTG